MLHFYKVTLQCAHLCHLHVCLNVRVTGINFSDPTFIVEPKFIIVVAICGRYVRKVGTLFLFDCDNVLNLAH